MQNRNIWALAALLAVAAATTAVAGDLIVVDKLDRRFPTGYCPFETRTSNGHSTAMAFTPGGPDVHITMNLRGFNSFGQQFRFRLDNIAVVRSDAFAAHSGVPPVGGTAIHPFHWEFCYEGLQDAPALFFEGLPPAELPFIETFDSSPGIFTLTGGAFYLSGGDGLDCDNNPYPNGGPLPSSGQFDGGGALAFFAGGSTSFDVTGLIPGTEYLLHGWWYSCAADTAALEVTVEGALPAPTGRSLLALNDVGQTSGVDQLVRIPDPVTGVGALVGALGSPFADCEALAVLPRTGTADRLFAVDNAQLLELDPATGHGTVIGPIGFADVDGLAFQPGTETLYGVTYGSNKLLRIDITTGHGTVVANNVLSGKRLDDIAFHPDGRAFILTGGTPRVTRVDLATGAPLQQWLLTGATSLESLVFSPNGSTLYSAGDRGTTKDLAVIDLATSTVAFVGTQSSGFRDIEALAWINDHTAALLARWGAPTDVAPGSPSAHLLQIAPNPFNPTTQVEFELVRSGRVDLSVHDVAGRLVDRLFVGHLSAGRHTRIWHGTGIDGRPVAAGLYYCTLRWDAGHDTQTMVLVK